MAVRSQGVVPIMRLVTLEGAQLGVTLTRHPKTGVMCLSFTDERGRRVAMVPRESVLGMRERLWQLAAGDGASYTLGPVDIAMVRKLASAA